MRTRVILLSLLLLTFLAVPVQAEPDPCEQSPEDPRCDPENIREYCAENPHAKRCAEAIRESLCNVIIVHIGTPSLQWDPILGLIEFNPEECYEVYVYSPSQKPPVLYLRYGA